MGKIISKGIKNIVAKLKIQGKKIVIVGGCFDLLHPGHVIFLEKAKAKGDFLIVLLESDESVRRKKGKGRPILSQADRAKVLSALKAVDLVITIPVLEDLGYDELIKQIQPDIIATSSQDPGIKHKKRQAQMIGAKLICVTAKIEGYSTSNIIQQTRNLG